MVDTVELTGSGTPRTPFSSGPDPMIGRQLLHYVIEERIGSGGMSVVYRGIDERLHRDVAIKVLHPFLAEKAECRARLAREARAVARLEHENILRIFDYAGQEQDSGDDAGAPRDEGFIVTEMVPGVTLKRFAEEHDLKQLPEVGALITWQLLHALAHAHKQGVVHRDLKPENVMVRTDGVLKLMDFGIAQVVDTQSLTVTGTLLGSPAHMAPECIEGYAADERSDIFSLATVMYWMCTGALPFEALSPHALLKAIVEGRYTPMQKVNPRVSDDLARILKRALHTDPDERFAHSLAFADALGEALMRSGIDPSAATLATWLKAPEERFSAVSETVREASLGRATGLLDEGQPAKAFSVLSRVLAEYPDNPRAQTLLEAASPLFDEEEDEDHTEDDLVIVPPSNEGAVRVVPADISAEVRAPAAPRSSRMGMAFAAVGVLALVGAAALLFAREQGRTTDPATVTVAATPPPADLEMNIGVPAVTMTPPDAPEVRRDRGVRGRGKTGRRGQAPRVTRKLAVRPAEPVPAESATPPADDSLETGAKAVDPVRTRPVEVQVNAPAMVSVDGAPATRVFGRQELNLAPGSHTLRFTAPAALDFQTTVVVPTAGSVPMVRAQLKPKPGLLTVRASVDGASVNADIFVRSLAEGAGEGRIVGTSKASNRRPIGVYFTPREGRIRGTEEVEVTVTARGHAPWVRRTTLTAGRVKTLAAVLKPATRDPEPTTP